MDSLTFIIPAYNDGVTIESLVEKTAGFGKKLHIPFDMLVVNDASRDSTGRILHRLTGYYPNLRIITHTKNAGYGRTIKELYQKARHEWLFSLPGDYQIEPGELAHLWPHRKEADVIIGWRRDRQDTTARGNQSRVYNALLRLLFGLTLNDANSVRLMKTSVMKSVSLTSSSAFVDAQLAIMAKRAGLQVIEIPIAHHARTGSGASGGKLSTILLTIRDMIQFRLFP